MPRHVRSLLALPALLALPPLLALLGCSLVGLTLAPSRAAAQTRVVVLEFGGGRYGAQARRAVVSALEGVVSIVPLERVEQAAQAQRADLATPAGAGAAARAEGAVLVVAGEVTGRERRARTRLVARDTAGRELASRTSGPPFGRPAQTALGAEAVAMVREAESALARETAAREAEARDAAREAQGPTAPTPDPAERTHPAGAAPLFRALLGVDARTRSAAVTLTDGGTRGYSAGPFPELMVALELRPLARSGGAASGLCFGVEAARSVALSSTLDSARGALSTSSLRVAATAGWLFSLADGAVELGPALGGGLDAFTVDANVVFPSTSYAYLRGGLAARFVLLGDALALGVSAGYRLVLGTGDLATAFGADGSAYGLDARAEASGALAVGFSYALRLGYERHGLAFTGGAGTLAEGTDGADSALRVQLLAGWQIQ